MNNADDFKKKNAEWERMVSEHAATLGLDIRDGSLTKNTRSNTLRRPLSIIRYEALKKDKRLINKFRQRGFSLRYIFEMLSNNNKIDYGYMTFLRYVAKIDSSDEDNIIDDDAHRVVTEDVATNSTNCQNTDGSNNNDNSNNKQYPSNYVGFKFNPNPDPDNLI